MAIVIGVTGKSGSGKSTFARNLANRIRGIHIDMDIMFHEQIEKNLDKIAIILNIDHLPTREEIGNIIFNDRDKYQEVTDIIYPPAIEELQKIITSNKVVIIDHILLPYMKEIWPQCILTYLIDTDEYVRLSRIILRDKLTLERARLRESASPTYENITFDHIIKE